MSQALVEPEVQVNRDWKLLINGKLEEGVTERQLFNPSTGEVLCKVKEASTEQVERAIQAARDAFDNGPWPHMTASERAAILLRVAARLEAEQDSLAQLETLNQGKPLRESIYDIIDSINCFRYYAQLISNPHGLTVEVPAPSVTTIVREPIGVCGMVVAWNYPFLLAAWKLAPALAAGNTCVLKPSEFTPLTILRLGEIFQEEGLPEGVVNIVVGDGRTVGQPISESKLVDKVAFTGSIRTGRLIAQAALGNLKKVTLELGGKSPMVVFEDYDVETAVDYALYAIYCNAGQVCSAGSRFIVHEAIHDKFVERLVERAKKIPVGPGFDESTEMGPLVSAQQMKQVLDYIEIGIKEGATLATGGKQLSGGKYKNGYYVEPTLFTNVDLNMRIVQEEIFGPVAVVQKFKDEKEAIALANGTDFGLAGAVFSNDITRAYRVVKALRAGITWVNGYHSCYVECPWGGYKQSGWGRELGIFGLETYTEVKQINVNLDPRPIHWFKP